MKIVRRPLFVFALLSLALTAQAQNVRTVQFRVVLVWSDGSNLAEKQDVSGMPGVQGTSRDGGAGQPLGGNAVSNMEIRISVLNDVGQTVAEASPSSQGDATFNVIGTVRSSNGLQQDVVYRVRVRGANIEEENIENVVPASQDRILTVRIRRKGEKSSGGGGVVAANALKIPGKAEKEFDKGSKALDEKKLLEAKAHFQKAIELYPKYDVAYNGLGVTLLQLGDLDGGRSAFEKSIEVNDKFAAGYRNLSRILARQKDFAQAAELLQRSLSLEPLNADALSRLCQYDYLIGKDTDVAELARKLHSIPHDGEALAHFAAGSSLERMNKPDEAILEYSIFVKEAPDSKLVGAAQEAIERCRQKLNESTTQ